MQEAVVVKLRLKNTALKVQKRKLLLQLRQVSARLKMFDANLLIIMPCRVRKLTVYFVLGLMLMQKCTTL